MACSVLGEIASLQVLASSSLWTAVFIKPQYMDNMMSHKNMGKEICFFMGCSGYVRLGMHGEIHLKGSGCFP